MRDLFLVRAWYLLAMPSRGRFSLCPGVCVCVCVCVCERERECSHESFPEKDASPLGPGPPAPANFLLQDPISRYSHIGG